VCCVAALLLALSGGIAGCQGPAEYRREADRVARDIIREKQQAALGRIEPFQVERSSDILRRKLLIDQNLPYTGPESLGTDQLPRIDHWPERDAPEAVPGADPDLLVEPDKPVNLSLMQALQVAARNSSEYQTQKESIFRAALDLDLERFAFRNTFSGYVRALSSTDRGGDETVSGIEASAGAGWSRKLKSGADLSAALAVDLAKLLTSGGSASFGLGADVSVSIPLMRGSGRHIVTEPLTQAERNVIYAIYEFERFRQNFIVGVAQRYLSVLQQMDELGNSEENYRSLITSARRSRRLAQAGRLPEIQVDQAVQNELRARNRWILSQQELKRRLDSFKGAIGLPPDARIEVDPDELTQVRAPADKAAERIMERALTEKAAEAPQADAAIDLAPPSGDDAGPMEIDEARAIHLALENRLDLRAAAGAVYDAQRQVVVAADGLRAELTLLGFANMGERRSIESATSRNATYRFDKGYYSALLTLDLPFERTPERNAYRERFIDLERIVRDFQTLEDLIKLDIKDELRVLLSSRETLKIQAQAVVVAQKRVKSSTLFLEAGRAQIRDLLEAQEALFTAKNALTSAAISYRIAELRIRSDMGLLEAGEDTLWRAIPPPSTGK
jgi:outer membrane protein TolC